MPAKFTFRLIEKPIFRTDIALTPFENINGDIVDYIHIRTKVLDDKGIEKPTKNGVTLLPDELEELLPHMIMGKISHEIISEKRRVWFNKDKEKPYLYKLQTIKLDGKENSMVLSIVEIRRIHLVKDKLFVKYN